MLLSLPSVAWPKAPIRSLVMDLVRGHRRSPPPSRRSPSRRSSSCARRSPLGSKRSRFGSCLSWGVELGPLPSTCKQTSDGNPTFVIGDPMNKVHTGKNKSLVSSASTNIDSKSILSIPMVCVKVLVTALSRG